MRQLILVCILVALASVASAEETFVELGQLALNTPVRHTISYKNPGRFESVGIEKVETSCECLRILSYPSEVDAKSAAEISFELTPDTLGHFSYELTVTPSSGKPQTFMLGVDVQDSGQGSVAASAVLPSRIILSREQEIYLTPNEIKAASAKPSFVDVRSETEYRQCHIPGSINLSRSFVRTKGWLKTKPVVLVDGGWGDPALEKTAQSLRNSGFTPVHILHGGLSAWRAAGQRTEGTLPGLPSLSEVAISDYLRSRNFDDWVVLDIRSAPKTGSLPESMVFSVLESAGKLKNVLTDLLKQENSQKAGETPAIRTAGILPAQTGFTKRILIVDEDGSAGSTIRSLLDGWGRAPVFYLKDGMQGVEKHQKMMTAARNSRKETTATRSRVARSGGSRSYSSGYRPKKKGGCGTCPH